MNFLKRKDIGRTIYFDEWDRSERSKDRVVKTGEITKVGLKNIGIDGNEYRMIEQWDHCLIVSRGSTTDHYIRIYLEESDVQAQADAMTARKKLSNVNLNALPLETVNELLKLIEKA